MLKDSATITTGTDTPKIAHTESRSGSFWDLNYPALFSLMNGQYYVEYYAIFGMMGIPIMLKAKWNKSIGWLGKNVNEIAEMTGEKVCHIIVSHAEKFSWVASYDGFYLTKDTILAILLTLYMMCHPTRQHGFLTRQSNEMNWSKLGRNFIWS